MIRVALAVAAENAVMKFSVVEEVAWPSISPKWPEMDSGQVPGSSLFEPGTVRG